MIKILIFLVANYAQADIGSNYGFGSSTASLAGSNRSFAYDGFALDRSPSLMTFMPTTNSYGLLVAHDFFDDIEGVETDSFFVGGSSEQGRIDTDVPDTVNFLFGSVWALGQSERNYRLGLTFSLPVDKVTEPATADSHQPQYSSYLSDSQRMTIALGFAGMLNSRLSYGLGVNYYLVQGATYQAKMPTDTGTGRTTSGNIKSTVKPAIAPVMGITWTDYINYFTLYFAGTRDQRFKSKSDVLIGVVGTTPVSFDSEASLFYDPETWSLGWARTGLRVDLLASLDWERWSRYDGGYMSYSFRTFQGSFQQYPVDIRFRDIIIPRLGINFKRDKSAIRLGMAMRPSTIESQSESNYIDPQRFVLGLGYGFASRLGGLVDGDAKIETHVQGHYLVPQDIKKSNSTSIGAPGYKAGGYVISYGVNLIFGI